MDFIRFFLLLIVPGIIAAQIFYLTANIRRPLNIYIVLVFDLIIFLINLWGLYYIKGIFTFEALIEAFNCLSFTRRYGELSIFVGIVTAVIAGVIARALNRCRCRRRC